MKGPEIATELDSIIGLVNEVIKKDASYSYYAAMHEGSALAEPADFVQDPNVKQLLNIRGRLLALHKKVSEA